MITCPACGYDPNPPTKLLSMEELWKERIYKIFRINADQPWWVEQTEYVCRWLKDSGINLRMILDIGCGDGRWIYGIKSVFPEAAYTGIDRLEDHILLNKERFPEISWVHGDVCSFKSDERIDTVFIMGTLNPILTIKDQTNLFLKVRELAPLNIVILFDRNSTGRDPAPWISDVYNLDKTLNIDGNHQGPKQDLIVWKYVWGRGKQNLEIKNAEV